MCHQIGLSCLSGPRGIVDSSAQIKAVPMNLLSSGCGGSRSCGRAVWALVPQSQCVLGCRNGIGRRVRGLASPSRFVSGVGRQCAFLRLAAIFRAALFCSTLLCLLGFSASISRPKSLRRWHVSPRTLVVCTTKGFGRCCLSSTSFLVPVC